MLAPKTARTFTVSDLFTLALTETTDTTVMTNGPKILIVSDADQVENVISEVVVDRNGYIVNVSDVPFAFSILKDEFFHLLVVDGEQDEVKKLQRWLNKNAPSTQLMVCTKGLDENFQSALCVIMDLIQLRLSGHTAHKTSYTLM